MAAQAPTIDRVTATAYTVPTEVPEADGTLCWDATTIVVVEVVAGQSRGLGYSYCDEAAAGLIKRRLAPNIVGMNAFAVPFMWQRMVEALRNVGWPGLGATAVSAVDAALWDLKARILDVSLSDLLGRVRDEVPIYGSGGFTNYSTEKLCDQLEHWVDELGCRLVKMKVGLAPETEIERVQAAAEAVAPAELMVDANGAYDRKRALEMAGLCGGLGVRWFEEPVSSDDLDGLRLIRDRAPAQMEIAAGEYAYRSHDVRRLLEAGAVDVIQLDATRLSGITGFLQAAALADAHGIPVSAHTAPALHMTACFAVPRLRHVEWFHDHVRLENVFFDGVPQPNEGAIRPDLSRPGNGLAFKRQDAERFAA